MKMDNRVFSLKEKLRIIFYSIIASLLVAVLFYRSLWVLLFTPVFLLIFTKREEQIRERSKKQQLEEEFISGIRILDTALQAGISMENAWLEVEREIGLLYGEKSLFYSYIKKMNHSVMLNGSLETLFLQVAEECQIEDMLQFAQILVYGKRSGGNWKKIIGSTVQRLSEKQETKKQIEVMVAEKKMEQQVMNIVPLGLLGFLQVSAWDYMSVMYHNPLGIICMTITLLGYGLSILLSQRILEIQV